MRTTQSLSITLPHEMAQMVKSKVSSGEYATESEVIRDGLRTLAARDAAVERWLIEEVAPTYDALKAGAKTLSADEAWAELEGHMNAAKKKPVK
jgi:putative addiction module CopG family antidote